jgi:hypothetical protein
MDCFDVYNQVTLRLPPNPYLSSEPLTTRIRATAAVPAKGRKPGTPAHFDTAMIIDRQGTDPALPHPFWSRAASRSHSALCFHLFYL